MTLEEVENEKKPKRSAGRKQSGIKEHWRSKRRGGRKEEEVERKRRSKGRGGLKGLKVKYDWRPKRRREERKLCKGSKGSRIHMLERGAKNGC